MTDQPLVSIIIPVYNGANYMREAIDSALAQNWPNVEVLVINDGSDDGGKTREMALSFGNRIRYFEKENGGVATALNLGISEMKGEYFSWLSHDDVYYPDKVAANMKFLAAFPDSIIYSNYEKIDGSGLNIEFCCLSPVKPEKLRVSFVTERVINGCSLLIPKKCFSVVGVFNESLMTSQDYDLWFRLAGAYRFRHIPEVLVKSRVHPEQSSRVIPFYYNESQTLTFSFIDQLTRSELEAFTSARSPALAYLLLAMRLLNPRYLHTVFAKYAIIKAFDCFPDEHIWGKLVTLLFLPVCFMPMARNMLFRLLLKIKTA